MANLRNYSELIRSQVKEFSQKDENWDWSVKGISKNQIKVRWTYLEYCGEKNNCFLITLSDGDAEDNDFLLGARTPDFGLISGYIVKEEPEHFWQESFDKAIKSALNVIFDYAHSRY